jgi:large subunit ribosomal protein L4
MPKKMRRKALSSAISERLREGRVTVVDAFELDTHKTKAFAATIAGLGHERRTLVVDATGNLNLQRAGRNIPQLTLSSGSVNVYDVLLHDRLIFTRAALEALAEKLGQK